MKYYSTEPIEPADAETVCRLSGRSALTWSDRLLCQTTQRRQNRQQLPSDRLQTLSVVRLRLWYRPADRPVCLTDSTTEHS